MSKDAFYRLLVLRVDPWTGRPVDPLDPVDESDPWMMWDAAARSDDEIHETIDMMKERLVRNVKKGLMPGGAFKLLVFKTARWYDLTTDTMYRCEEWFPDDLFYEEIFTTGEQIHKD